MSHLKQFNNFFMSSIVFINKKRIYIYIYIHLGLCQFSGSEFRSLEASQALGETSSEVNHNSQDLDGFWLYIN